MLEEKEKPGADKATGREAESMNSLSHSGGTTSREKTYLEYAIEYVERGVFVLPLIPGEKRPYVEWKHRRDQKPTEAEVRDWWHQFPDADIGMATGEYSGVDVLDFDSENARPHFEYTVSELPEGGPTVETGRDGGRHIWFKHTPGLKNISKPKDPNENTIDMDVRTTGGIVVLPPCKHKSGKRYKFTGVDPLDMDPEDWREELPGLPQQAADFLKGGKNGTNTTASSSLDLNKVLQGVPDGERDDTLFRYCCRLRGKNLSYKEVEFLALNAAALCDPPFPQEEAYKCIESAWKYDPDLSATAEWDEPVSLNESHPDPMPDDILPGVLGDYVKAVSESTETPLELGTGLALSVVATTVQGDFIIQVKQGYTEPLNTWTAAALPPGERKSTVLTQMVAPLNTWEAEETRKLSPWIESKASERANQEARIKALRKKYGSADKAKLPEIQEEISDIEADLVEVPPFPKVWAQDVTPEHLGTLMNRHDEKMSILSAEGGIFDILAGKYSNGIPNLDLFLQGHAGDAVRVDRGSREPVRLDNPALTLGLSPQPDVLKAIASKPGFRGRGLLARPLYLLPRSNLGQRQLTTTPVPEDIRVEYERLIHRLLDMTPPENEHGDREPFIIHLENNSYNDWLEFAKEVEIELREGGRFEYMRDWAGKLPGAAARLAGLLHCCVTEQPWMERISPGTMQRALSLASVLAHHAVCVFDLMGADEGLDNARKVWRWIERGRHEDFKRRECFQALKGTFQRIKDIEEPLSILVERNYIREEKEQPEGGGRPSLKYHVNPSIIRGWS